MEDPTLFLGSLMLLSSTCWKFWHAVISLLKYIIYFLESFYKLWRKCERTSTLTSYNYSLSICLLKKLIMKITESYALYSATTVKESLWQSSEDSSNSIYCQAKITVECFPYKEVRWFSRLHAGEAMKLDVELKKFL